MSALADKRCLNHRAREAVARCPNCGDFYCRECIAEHEGRVLCARCLSELAGSDGSTRTRISLMRPILAAACVVLLWVCFFALGRTLITLPDSFHDGTVWGRGTPGSNDETGP